MSSPRLVPTDALTGIRVGMSVSDSADLERLGLAPAHCELAVAELARAILIAGGSIVYGGRLVPVGFTQVLLEEVHRFASDRDALTICLSASEHAKMSAADINRHLNQTRASARIVCLTEEGEEVDLRDRDPATVVDVTASLTAMRRYINERCDARVIVGGRLAGSQGGLPGVLEEAILTVQANRPLYVAGGFGGAAAAVTRALGYDDLSWAPSNYPSGIERAHDALAQLQRVAASGLPEDGLDDDSRRQLAVTHRPSDIASTVVYGLGSR